MSPEGSVLDIHFPAERLNDMAGDPYWIDLTVDEATALFDALSGLLSVGSKTGELAVQARPIVTLN